MAINLRYILVINSPTLYAGEWLLCPGLHLYSIDTLCGLYHLYHITYVHISIFACPLSYNELMNIPFIGKMPYLKEGKEGHDKI